ncbi:MAG: di-heme-cytochrome C peroxidase [Alphaproteobacteria bacterium]
MLNLDDLRGGLKAARHALMAVWLAGLIIPGAARAQPAADLLDQGWTPEFIQRWSYASQGSRLMPMSWLRALEQADKPAPFLDRAFMASLGYLPGESADGTPLELPIGFAIDSQDSGNFARTGFTWFAGQGSSEDWVGMNCAACHTGQITFGAATLRVQGAPGRGNFQVLMEQLIAALAATRADNAKFTRFAAAVLGSNNSAANRNTLRNALGTHLQWVQKVETTSRSGLRYGFGRLDAIGHILNKVALLLDERNAAARPADAPVSYPQIWNAPQHDFVQWNGIAGNQPTSTPTWILSSISDSPFDIGALGRNAGEVIGVFGDVNTASRGLFLGGVRSSLNIRNLVLMEQALDRLRSPRWPETVLGPIDAAARQRGDELFDARCKTCHAPLARDDLTSRITAQMAPATAKNRPAPADLRGRSVTGPSLTDPAMVCNTATFQARSGFLAGTQPVNSPTPSVRVQAVDSGEVLLSGLVRAALVSKVREIGETAVALRFGFDAMDVVMPRPQARRTTVSPSLAPQGRDDRCLSTPNVLIAYKARPLNGIWATAPYLHNGSVISLYELLLPPDQRRKTFFTGTSRFDPRNVGFVPDQAADNPFRFSTVDATGRPLRGNSNAGHDYGNAQLTEQNRRDLVEYLKSL